MNVYNDVLHNARSGVNSDEFWYNDISILLSKSRAAEFYPSYDMTMVEKLNAIMRLSIYIGAILFLLKNNYQYLAIPVLIGAFTVFVYKTQLENLELFFTTYDSYTNRQNQDALEKNDAQEVLPTIDNPFMNYLHGVSNANTNRAPAKKSYNNDVVKHEIETKFNHNLYRNVDDIYSKSHGQLNFYTMPVTTVTSDQTAYAKWLYNTGPTLKEDTTKGAPNWNPVEYLEPDSTC